MLASRESAIAWELRGAWASRSVVVLSCEKPARWASLAGWVESVSPTDAAALVETIEGETVLIPCEVILSVRRPHFHEPGDEAALRAVPKPRRVTILDHFPGQLALWEEVS